MVLAIGYAINTLPGAMVGGAAQALAVMSEAAYAGWRVRPVLRDHLSQPSDQPPLTWRAFANFYIPLALTSLITLLWQPVGSAALSRMPSALNSLAVWPVLSGLTFLLRSFGFAINEVVVALLSREGAYKQLKSFSRWLAFSTTTLHLLIVATPLAGLYFSRVSALPPDLAELARIGFWLALPMPALSVYQNWFQGTILFGRLTRSIPEAVAVFFVTVLIVLGIGVALGRFTGLYVAMTGFVLANFTQMVWLWYRSREVRVE